MYHENDFKNKENDFKTTETVFNNRNSSTINAAPPRPLPKGDI